MSITPSVQSHLDINACMKILTRFRIIVIVLAIVVVVMAGFLAWVSINYFNYRQFYYGGSSGLPYKILLLDMYHYYGVALRSIQAARDLLIANYYAQYLPVQHGILWILDGLLDAPKLYVNDSIKIIDAILELVKNTSWPSSFNDEVEQLKQYIYELRLLAIQIQQIVNRDTYTANDIELIKSLTASFSSYNDKIYKIIETMS
ncbi:MAG: hypothetical protein QXZ41_05010 [Ignisphaera sp.]